jgi:hypothetical protein
MTVVARTGHKVVGEEGTNHIWTGSAVTHEKAALRLLVHHGKNLNALLPG